MGRRLTGEHLELKIRAFKRDVVLPGAHQAEAEDFAVEVTCSLEVRCEYENVLEGKLHRAA